MEKIEFDAMLLRKNIEEFQRDFIPVLYLRKPDKTTRTDVELFHVTLSPAREPHRFGDENPDDLPEPEEQEPDWKAMWQAIKEVPTEEVVAWVDLIETQHTPKEKR